MNIKTNYLLNRDESPYLYIDEIENAIDSLEIISFIFGKPDKLKWKWIIICLHHSLYHFCVSNLKGTNWRRVLKAKNHDDNNVYFKREDEKWKKSEIVDKRKSGSYKIRWIEIKGEPSLKENKSNNIISEFLIPFWTAIARVQDVEFWMNQYIFSKPLELSEKQLKSIEHLVEYRNRFVHFIPIGSMSNIKYFINIVPDILDIIEFLALESGNVFYVDNESEQRIRKIISEIKEKI